MQNFMRDRYGVDELTTVLGLAGMVLALVGALIQVDALSWIALAVMVLALLRAFSKKLDARSRENESFRSFAAGVPGLRSLVEKIGGPYHGPSSTGRSTGGARSQAQTRSKEDYERAKRTAKAMWSKRKTSRFLKCPTCGQILSVPKGKGRIRVTCPKCHTKMETKS